MEKRKPQPVFYPEYKFFSLVLLVIFIYAFIVDSPANIWQGLMKIITSRSLLITDYMAVGGSGAMLMNGALTGGFALALMWLSKVKPNGAIIMALWMTVGFGFFGKNVLNMLPLTFGVWLYSRLQKDPFINYSLAALLVATLSPVVSEFAFGDFGLVNGMIAGVFIGIAVGFIFPILSAFSVRVHDGYNLYNMGFAGGVIAMFLIAALKSFGIDIETSLLWGTGMNLEHSVLLFILSAMLIAAGIIAGRKKGLDLKRSLKRIGKSSGRLVSDYFTLYEESSYINMGVLGIFATSLTLALGADVNGPTMGGILTIIAFGCFGKHLKNVLPLVVGAVLSTYANTTDPTAPANILAVLFSTGLAPIAGQFGVVWGVIAGFLHVNVVLHAGYASNGLNLYNNGFAGGFVALVLVPIILSLTKARDERR